MENKKNTQACRLMIGGLAAGVLFVGSYPINVFLTRWMTSAETFSTANIKKILLGDATGASRSDQFKSVWSGVGIAGLYRISSRTFRYGCQPILAEYLEKNTLIKMTSSTLSNAVAGGIIGAVEVGLFYPLDTLKIKRQKNIRTPLWQLLHKEGRYLYKGMTISLCLKASFFSILFGGTRAMLSFMKIEKTEEANFKQLLTASGSASILGAFFTNPLAVMKTRLQCEEGKVSPLSLFKKIRQEEGMHTFFRGTSMRVLLSVPRTGLMLALVTLMTNYFTQPEPNRYKP